jgi:hypothetical protein
MDWIAEELKSMNLGDKRLNKRAKIILNALSGSPEKSIPSAHNGWSETKAAYRFMSNPNVGAEQILGVHRAATLKRIEEHQIIVIPQDTSELDYGKQHEKLGRGPTNHKSHRGIYLHPLVAFNEFGLCLGVLGAKFWHRAEIGNRNRHLTKPIEEKESFRWLEGLREVNKLGELFPEKQFVMLADREGDIYEILAEKRNANVDYIIRGHHDRILLSEDTKLLETISAQAPITTVSFEFKQRDKTSSPYRQVEQKIQVKKVTIIPSPSRGNRVNKTPVEITVILATEINPNPNCQPLNWLLLTSLNIETPEQAIKVIQHYLSRWKIEIYFKVLKSGCKVEELQLNELESLVTCLSFYMIIAWRVMYLIQLGRDCPDMSCEVFFEKEEWRAAYMVKHRKEPPIEPPTLNEMIHVIAALGGFLGRKSDGDPGPKHLWIGIQRTRDFAHALGIHREIVEGSNTCG